MGVKMPFLPKIGSNLAKNYQIGLNLAQNTILISSLRKSKCKTVLVKFGCVATDFPLNLYEIFHNFHQNVTIFSICVAILEFVEILN